MKLKFIGIKDEVENVKTFLFEPQESITWEPGQYMHYVLDLQNPDEKGAERWFTISNAPFEKNISITTRLDNLPISAFKQYLLSLNPGDEIESDGPKGKFLLRPNATHHVMIAGGIGVPPFRSMLVQLAHDKKPANATLLYANRDDKIVFEDELKQIEKIDGTFKTKVFIGQWITHADFDPFSRTQGVVFYLSGPKAMVASYEETLRELSIAEENIMTDYFPGYK